jgi:hypothetical protein
MDIELSLYLLETLAPDQAAVGAPALLDGYRALWDVTDALPDDATVRMANARILLWRRMQRPFRWDRLIDAYLSVPEHIRGYNLDDHGPPRRRACRVAPDRWSVYEALLTQPLPFDKAPVRIAEPGRRYRMSSTARGEGVKIPDELPEFATAKKHDLDVRPRRGISATWTELLATAQEMDATDRALGRANDWEKRLREVTLQVRDADDAFRDADTFTIDTMLHVLGIVSVGKTTFFKCLVGVGRPARLHGDRRGRRQLGRPAYHS